MKERHPNRASSAVARRLAAAFLSALAAGATSPAAGEEAPAKAPPAGAEAAPKKRSPDAAGAPQGPALAQAGQAGQSGGAPPPPGPPAAAAAAAPNAAPAATAATQAGKPPEESQLSFNGANVEVVMKWLAEVTGKSVARHKGVQCQLTVLSPKKVPTREAIQLVYRALALEGFSAIETRNAILLVPEANELKAASAELVDGERTGPLEGKQVLVKVFPVTSTTAERLRERVKGVLSEKGKIDVDETSNKLIVTDFADNLQLLGKLLAELDVASPAQKEMDIVTLRHLPAEDLALLITAAFNGEFSGSAAAAQGPVQAFADAKGNRILLTAVRGRLDEVKTFIASLDVEQKADLAVRVLPLQHAVAKELAPEIGPLALKALGGAPGAAVEITPSVRSNALLVLSTAAGFEAVKSIVTSLDAPPADHAVRILPLQHAIAKELAPEIGPLALKALGGAQTVDITASARSNALIVLSSAAAFETVKGIVSSLDAPATSRASPLRVFKLQHAHADRVRDILKPLLSPLGKVEIEEHLRKVIVSDTLDNLHFFEELISELDVPAAADVQTIVVTLQHGEADDLADLLNSVYGEGGRSTPGPLKPGGVRIFNDDIGNRIVISAGKEKIEEVKSLVSILDAEKQADFTLRVISLQFVKAKDLAEEIEPLYQRSTRASRERVEIAANARANSLLVLSSAGDYAAIQEIVAILDTKDAEEKTMKAYVLKNADADDVATQLGELYRDNGQDDYFSYYYGRRGRGGEDDVKVRFVADRRRNAVIAIAPPARLESIAPVIQSLDEPIEGEQLVPKIYTLKFVSALDVETVLNELFLKKTQRRSYYYYDDTGGEEEHRDIGRLYGKIRIASEPYTNSLIVSSNSGENFSAVEEILKQLDVPSQTGSSTLYLQLKYAKAVTIANNLNILFAGPGSPARGRTQQEGQPSNQQQQQQGQQGRANSVTTTSFELEQEVMEESYYPWLGGGGGQQDSSRTTGARGAVTRPVSDLVGKVRVVPDVRTNSLMVTSNLHFFPQVMNVVEELDIPTSQVLIEAKIIEVGRDGKSRMGVRWSPDGSQVFDRDDLDNSIIASTSTTYRDVFAGSALADAMRTGILDVRVDLDFLIQFLQKNAESRVRAEPRINVADNERGKLFVGSRVPFISSSLTTTEGGRNDAFEYIDVGIILEVTPHINNKNEVDLKIRVESSQIRQGETLFGGAIIDTRNYRTDITVQSGETLVLGGIIQSEESEIERKVPLIGDIPFLGWLFKKVDTVNRDVELMVFLKPTVTQGPEDVRRLMEAETRKTPQIRRFDQRIDAERRMETEALEQELREMEPLPVPDNPPPAMGTEPPRAPAPAEQPRAAPPAGSLEARSE